MRLLGLLCLLLLCACRTPAALEGIASSAGVVSAVAETVSPDRQNATSSTELLPSYQRTGVVSAAASLLQRPQTGSLILKPLAAAATVQILGELDNADGQWLSVAIEDTQGWVRAAQIKPNP